MICSLCSLLCDQPVLHATCPLRLHALSKTAAPARDPVPRSKTSAKELLRTATSIHIGGRFHSVETSRAAIEFARAYGASIDGSHPSGMFDATQAIAAHGAYLASLAEARSTSDCLLIVNPKGLRQHFPQLPAVLNKRLAGGEYGVDAKHCIAPKSDSSVILIGSTDEKLQEHWSEHFSQVLSYDCDVDSLPQLLMGLATESQAGWETQAEWMQRFGSARYPMVVWGSIALPIPAIDLWAERMQTWYLQWNEHSRSSGLMLSSLANVFQHVCTWLTGFPSRIDFSSDEMRWDREEASTARWLERNRDNDEALLIWVDESSHEEPIADWRSRPVDRLRVIELVAHGPNWQSADFVPSEERQTRQRIPIGRPGVDYPASLLRADQVVMAYPEAEASLRVPDLLPCDAWLRSMLPKDLQP
ncbi:hypothetical protein SH467x_004022 [Pirellulaceae bacterium SH467]